MNDYSKWLAARRDLLRITGPVYTQDAFTPMFCDDEYRREIVKAADAEKPKPRKPTPSERKRHKEAATKWIKAMAAWAKNPRNPLPGRK